MSDKGMPTQSKPDPRTYFAAERTFLAWIRTGLALMGFGFVVARFGLFLRELQSVHGAALQSPHTLQASLWFGVALVGLGVGVNIFAAVHHVRVVHQLSSGAEMDGKPSKLGIAVASILAASGVAVSAYLVFVK